MPPKKKTRYTKRWWTTNIVCIYKDLLYQIVHIQGSDIRVHWLYSNDMQESNQPTTNKLFAPGERGEYKSKPIMGRYTSMNCDRQSIFELCIKLLF